MIHEFDGLFLLLLSAIIALLAWALKKLISIDNAVAGFKAWVIGHDKQDDERHVEIKKALENLWKSMDE